MAVLLYPVILAGGSGTRLWPLSRKNFPKQFLRLRGESSLLQQTVQRTQNLSFKELLLLSNDMYYFLCQEQLMQTSCKPLYLLEPCARNTAPAIASAAHTIAARASEDAVMLVLPSDHWVADDVAWCDAMQKGIEFAHQESAIVTFGIKPTSAKTGYGYIDAVQQLTPHVLSVRHFREKPDLLTATDFIAQGHYYWNSGIFVCRVKTYLDELARMATDIFNDSLEAVATAYHHHDYMRLGEEAFTRCRAESIDYAVMEHTDKAVMVPLDTPWSDLGCWTSVAEAQSLDENGNSLHGKVLTKDSYNCFVSSADTLVTTLGVSDQIIVATADAILVADKSYSQQVKDMVSMLGRDHYQLTEEHVRVFRPWGYYETLAEGPRFKVKRLMVSPGAKISLQMHQHRAEHWVVVGGKAVVINDENILHLAVNQSTYISQRTKHRLSNESTEPLYVIEVQSGDYLGEDDIIRFDDVYERVIQDAEVF